MALKVDALLDRLQNTSAIDLWEMYSHPVHASFWESDPRLYRAFARAMLKEGFPTLALSVARRGLEVFLNDLDLGYVVALAYGRGGNIASAELAIAPLLDAATRIGNGAQLMSPSLRIEIFTLRGRLFKDHLHRESDGLRRNELARQSAEWYFRASELPQADAYPLINAATMRLFSGDREGASSLAAKVLAEYRECDDSAQSTDYWLWATFGEAHTILGQHDLALTAYTKAVDLAVAQVANGALVSMLSNLRLLARCGIRTDCGLIEARLGKVVVFSGHRVDPPSAHGNYRFPDDVDLVRRVQLEIRTNLDQLNARFGFCSLAAGSDILFAEAMLDRGAELHVVLPFAIADFVRTSVDIALPNDACSTTWRQRFHGVLSRLKADQLHYATTEPFLETNILFGYANRFLQGLAIVRAQQCLIEPQALVVLDSAAAALSGGTREFLDDWRKAGRRADIIDLAQLRGGTPIAPVGPAATSATRQPHLPRTIRAMLFADVAGFSKMAEDQAPRFFADFPRAVANLLTRFGDRVLLANTWGDGFFAVFDGVVDCAEFALELLAQVGQWVDWSTMGFPDSNPLRVGLHAGPVFEIDEDPILRRRNFFGRHVNRAARIEPVTIPGCAFASEQFAGLLAMESHRNLSAELIGLEKLPKANGSLSLYRIIRREQLCADNS
jgi:class 3 adenylate cyclase/tetratricopeptide (TPR) repeat protein